MTQNTYPLLSYFSNQDSFIVRTENFNQLKSNLENNSQFSNFIEKAGFENSVQRFNLIKNISIDQNAMISLREVGKGSLDFFIVTFNDRVSLKPSDHQKHTDYQGNEILQEQYGSENTKNSLYRVSLETVSVISSSKILIENVIRNHQRKQLPETLVSLFEVTDKNSLYYRLNPKDFWVKNGFSSIEKAPFGQWSALAFNIANKRMEFHGFNTRNDSLPYFLNLFQNNLPKVFELPALIPEAAEEVQIYGLDNMASFNNAQDKFKNRSFSQDTLYQDVDEIAVIKLKDNSLGLLHFKTAAPINIMGLVAPGTTKTAYRDYTVYKTADPKNIKNNFIALWETVDPQYVCVVEQSLVFAKEIAPIKTVIGNRNTNTTLENNRAFNTTKESLAAAANILFYRAKTSDLETEKTTDFFLIPSHKKDQNTKIMASQWVGDKDFFHQHAVFLDLPPKKDNGGVSPLLNLQLDHPIIGRPQWVKNHKNNQQEILVQDAQNQLYLFDNSGKLLWKKALSAPIQGKVQQVDIYKNGRLQLAFTTENQWLILDRNGKEVAPFNKTFKEANLSPLAVFDYDKRKEYRFVFAQGRDIFMYDRTGKTVKGFRFKKAKSSILETPKHFRIKGKDYLVFKGIDGSLELLNRTGKTRVKTAKKYAFSDNELALLDQQFSFTDLGGNLLQIDAKGTLSKRPLKVNAAHKTAMQYNQLVVLEDNILYSKGKKAVLDYGIYTPPEVFNIDRKNYIGITDIQNKKAYLFNSELQLLPKFPVYGNGAIDLTKSEKNGALKMLTKDKDNSLMVYQIKK